jgi:thiol-disulfide isomerase/thioredoxin
MATAKRFLPWTFRIILSVLFLLSAAAKLYPSPTFGITLFEIKQLVPLGFNACFAPYFSRFIIGAEISLGLALLQPHFLKSIVVPISTLLLAVFVGHLTYEIIVTGNEGNCGCFGALIPMTPVEAIIKNLLAIGMLGYLFFNTSDKEKGKNNFYILTSLFLGSALFMFGLTPIEKCETQKTVASQPNIIEVDTAEESTTNVTNIPNSGKTNPTDTSKLVKINLGPKKVTSAFSQLVPGIDEGKKLLCFFAPGCDHCQAAAKSLAQLSKNNPDFPKVHIIFMDEETEKIPEFFKIAGKSFNHQILGIAKFYNTLGSSKDTPGVALLWNGNIIKFFDGTNANQYDAAKLKAELTKMK